MIKLDTTTRSLEVLLAGNVTTSQLQITVAYSDHNDSAGTLDLAASRTVTNNTTAVTILAAPASGKTRTLDYAAIYNADTVSATVFVQLNDNSTIAIQSKVTLTTGQTLQYTREGGWRIVNAPFTISGTVTVAGTVTANAGTNLNTSALALESGGNLATIASAIFAEDVASANADKGIQILAVQKATPADTAGADGDYVPLQVSAGRLWCSAKIDTALPAGSAVIGAVTQSGTWNITAVTNVVHVDDNSGSLTVDAPVGTPVFVRLSDGSSAITTLPVSIADGSDVTLGTKTDAKNTATDTTSVSIVSVLKQISASVQAPPSQAVTNAGTFAVQATLAAETTKIIGTVNIASSQVIGTNADASISAGTAPSKALIAGLVYNSTEISPTTGQTFALQADSHGRLRNVIMDGAGNTRAANVTASGELLITGNVVTSGTATVTGSVTVAGSVTVSSGSVTASLSSSTNAGATVKTTNYNTGAGTDTVTMFGIALPASGGAVAGGTATNPIQVSLANTAANSTAVKVDGSAVTQPVSIAAAVTVADNVASSTTQSSVAGSASSVQLLASNGSRKMATFFNDSTAMLYLRFGTTASQANATVAISPGGYYELPHPVYTGRIDGIWTSATGNVRITEY